MATSPTVLTLAPGEQPETELEVRRSRFLARAARTDTEQDARAFITSVRAAYPDARPTKRDRRELDKLKRGWQ